MSENVSIKLATFPSDYPFLKILNPIQLPTDTGGAAGMFPNQKDPWETSVKRTGSSSS